MKHDVVGVERAGSHGSCVGTQDVCCGMTCVCLLCRFGAVLCVCVCVFEYVCVSEQPLFLIYSLALNMASALKLAG